MKIYIHIIILKIYLIITYTQNAEEAATIPQSALSYKLIILIFLDFSYFF
jgi:hypothetical protein